MASGARRHHSRPEGHTLPDRGEAPLATPYETLPAVGQTDRKTKGMREEISLQLPASSEEINVIEQVVLSLEALTFHHHTFGSL